MTTELTHNGAVITVEPDNGRGYIDRSAIMYTLDVHIGSAAGIEGDELTYRTMFARAYGHSTVSGDLGFAWPDDLPNQAALLECMAHWLNLPGELVQKWLEATFVQPEPPAPRPVPEDEPEATP